MTINKCRLRTTVQLCIVSSSSLFALTQCYQLLSGLKDVIFEPIKQSYIPYAKYLLLDTFCVQFLILKAVFQGKGAVRTESHAEGGKARFQPWSVGHRSLSPPPLHLTRQVSTSRYLCLSSKNVTHVMFSDSFRESLDQFLTESHETCHEAQPVTPRNVSHLGLEENFPFCS